MKIVLKFHVLSFILSQKNYDEENDDKKNDDEENYK